MKLKVMLTGSLLLLACVSFADAWRAEAENFRIPEGWQIGVGKDLSGGKSVAALKKEGVLTGDYRLAKAGTFYVWVRTLTFV